MARLSIPTTAVVELTDVGLAAARWTRSVDSLFTRDNGWTASSSKQFWSWAHKESIHNFRLPQPGGWLPASVRPVRPAQSFLQVLQDPNAARAAEVKQRPNLRGPVPEAKLHPTGLPPREVRGSSSSGCHAPSGTPETRVKPSRPSAPAEPEPKIETEACPDLAHGSDQPVHPEAESADKYHAQGYGLDQSDCPQPDQETRARDRHQVVELPRCEVHQVEGLRHFPQVQDLRLAKQLANEEQRNALWAGTADQRGLPTRRQERGHKRRRVRRRRHPSARPLQT